MCTEYAVAVDQATTIRPDGGAEFVSDNASIQPDRQTFAGFNDVTDYLTRVLGGQPEGRDLPKPPIGPAVLRATSDPGACSVRARPRGWVVGHMEVAIVAFGHEMGDEPSILMTEGGGDVY
jgi:hypothetical protein